MNNKKKLRLFKINEDERIKNKIESEKKLINEEDTTFLTDINKNNKIYKNITQKDIEYKKLEYKARERFDKDFEDIENELLKMSTTIDKIIENYEKIKQSNKDSEKEIKNKIDFCKYIELLNKENEKKIENLKKEYIREYANYFYYVKKYPSHKNLIDKKPLNEIKNLIKEEKSRIEEKNNENKEEVKNALSIQEAYNTLGKEHILNKSFINSENKTMEEFNRNDMLESKNIMLIPKNCNNTINILRKRQQKEKNERYL